MALTPQPTPLSNSAHSIADSVTDAVRIRATRPILIARSHPHRIGSGFSGSLCTHVDTCACACSCVRV